MHAHLEIVMPPTGDVEAKVAEIMAQYDENNTGEDVNEKYTFFDWYEIGGRWSGAKITDAIGAERIQEFYELLTARNVTVSSVQAGKQSLRPESQISMVDALWCEHFPDAPTKQCPLFAHYEGDAGDVMKLADAPMGMKCERVIIAGPAFESEKIKACYMVSQHMWNGVNHVDSQWDGTIGAAIDGYKSKMENYKKEWADAHTPGDDWLVVTVDYHD